MNLLASLAAAAQDELATLLGGPTQHARLLRLHLAPGGQPLAATLTPERLHATEAILPANDDACHGFRLSVSAVSPQDELDIAALLGQPARVDLLLADQSARPFHGRVTEARHLGSDAGPRGGGLSRYQLVIEPWLAFAAQRHDSFVFQDLTVPQILEAVFADYAELGPAWRFELLDASVYPRRSLCVQHAAVGESDLAFVLRLLGEEGLFAWFEHAASDDAGLGTHTLVIADHNGALRPCAQPVVRYAQAGPTLAADALQRFTRRAALTPTRVAHASFDYRSLGQRPGSAESTPPAALQADLAWRDQPGLYAWQDAAQAERLARRQLEALQSRAARSQAGGTVRAFGPGQWFTLAEHSSVSLDPFGRPQPEPRYAVLRVEHRARNNLSADPVAGGIAPTLAAGRHNHDNEPLYANQAEVQALSVPVRAPLADPRLGLGRHAPGVQTAIVVGVGTPVHTDRDHRIKVQFHWQRGAGSSARLDHPSESNAPADASAGTWVRVAESLAGPNWGAHFTPRVGQEVLVDFIEGDIERPVVIGSLYNGAGTGNAQGNDVSGGGAGSSGNAPAWFPGDAAAGELDGHAHAAMLSGFKTQALDASATGGGGHNHLVLDDTPGQSRITLGTTQAATHLSIGHLLHQADNQRLHPRGHGLELATTAWGAVRAAQALLLSAHGQGGGSTRPHASLDNRAAQAQLGRSAQLQSALTQSAHAQQAKLPNEADTLGATHATQQALQAWQGTTGIEAGLDDERDAGGLGTTTAANRPDLLLASPAGIAAHTPQHHLAAAGSTLSLSSDQDVNVTAQQHLGAAAQSGLLLYTVGQARDASKPNQETGLRLHAASGSVSVQAQGGALDVNAQQALTLDSTQASIQLSAPNRILLTGAGSALEINGADITLTTSGAGAVHAASKVLTGGGSASARGLRMPAPSSMPDVFSQQLDITAILGVDASTGNAQARLPYKIKDRQGRLMQQGITDSNGLTGRVFTKEREELVAYVGEGEWQFFADVAHAPPVTSNQNRPHGDDA
jgi:type VI secretion system secreted protein VgrG